MIRVKTNRGLKTQISQGLEVTLRHAIGEMYEHHVQTWKVTFPPPNKPFVVDVTLHRPNWRPYLRVPHPVSPGEYYTVSVDKLIP
jgi:hypothetical protein